MHALFLFDIYRRQVETMQNLASASLSGFERAQQAALSNYRQVVNEQLETTGRAIEQAASVALDPERIRPAVSGLIEAQRDLMSAIVDTQRRCIDAVTPGQLGETNGGSAYFDTLRQSVDQWQRWTDQMLHTAREETERMANEVQQRSNEMARSAVQAARGLTDSQQEAAKKTEDAMQGSARRQTEQRSAGQRPS